MDPSDTISAMILIKYGCYGLNYVLITDVKVFFMFLEIVSGSWNF